VTHGTSTPQQQHSPSPWPEGVTHRYLTKAAEITGNHELGVNISEDKGTATSRCTGCGRRESENFAREIHYRAQQHAEKCRAVPRPAVTQ
jgi:hypothetical protein